jgi:aminoglycoside phosphotransferase (APT) family kinase protein
VVGSPPGVDLDAFTHWAATALPQATPPFTAQTLVGGQSNITVRIDDATGHAYVLRRPPLHGVLATAHDVGREHRIMAALQPTPVPLPPTLAVCDDTTVLGAPFFVMRHVEGVVLEHVAEVEAGLPEPLRRPAAESLVDTLVALHAVDPDAVGLGDLAPRDDLVGRQLRRWHAQYGALAAAGVGAADQPTIDHVHAVLAARVPDQLTATSAWATASSTRRPARWSRCSTGSSAPSATHSSTSATCSPPGPMSTTPCARRPTTRRRHQGSRAGPRCATGTRRTRAESSPRSTST